MPSVRKDVHAAGAVRAIGLCDVDLELFQEVLEWARRLG